MDKPKSTTDAITMSAPLEKGSRGRNGVFTARSVEVYARPADGGQYGMVSVDAYSGRQGRAAPLQLGLSPEDALALAVLILKSVGHIVGMTPAQLDLMAGQAVHEGAESARTASDADEVTR